MSESVRRIDPREERINDPANPKHYWQYRLHLNLEDLIEHKEFTKLVRQSIADAERI
jgi:4-alpha-glucanotransferase